MAVCTMVSVVGSDRVAARVVVLVGSELVVVIVVLVGVIVVVVLVVGWLLAELASEIVVFSLTSSTSL